MRQRRGAPVEDESSSSSDDDDDAFARLSKSKGGKDNKNKTKSTGASQDATSGTSVKLPASTTSSMKRHHVASSDSRKQKMNALLQELEVEKARRPLSQPARQMVPEKKGSFVPPEEEHLTTNIFVGNLAPSITEEEITDFFGQFGDLYSVKVMWPRTPEERARNRNTGFVCFMHREDAEEAIKFDERDVFKVGRRIMMRWGKNVKKIIKAGTGGVAVASQKQRQQQQQTKKSTTTTIAYSDSANRAAANRQKEQVQTHGTNVNNATITSLAPSSAFGTIPTYVPETHQTNAVVVQVPPIPSRAHFISTVASFVAKDGSILEEKLIETEAANPDFAFLVMPPKASQQHANSPQFQHWLEHIYYRWRVYSFSQGDSFRQWRAAPFVMTHPNNGGVFWIPPPINVEAARQEDLEQKMRDEDRDLQKKQRRRRIRTGRQLETGGGESSAHLTRAEMEQFHRLVRTQLCASREAICQAMAFCFEKSKAADQIARLLKELLLEDDKTCAGISVDTRIARLYLLSDILFNSQQPGVRNAFLYRDRIERMAPEVFASLGKHGSETGLGRMSKNKLSSCVSAVLGAWTNWGVYNPLFLDEVHARFEGREVKQDDSDANAENGAEETPPEDTPKVEAAKVISESQRQEWAQVSSHQDERMDTSINNPNDDEMPPAGLPSGNRKRKAAKSGDDDGGDDIDGHSLDSEEIDEEDTYGSDLDGEALTVEDFDGMDLHEDFLAEIRNIATIIAT
ncbi:U2 snRNP-associated SURP motif-containing protein [Seminavis robusta]|uniref:U2 snRNP-associated SURP motif-containing protein n=1 Tax=Seminavis robusta TaxID=568900 RepID=A0A9N8E835_9STRA|nr:U2 snRNP-associated SURP motif-containing protein [Seminavis robusta]|eukprot:Sro598_g173050.1 U2 snRNP-associated SURP motif-containing protein (741) ;mRNA; f:35326-37773